MRRLLTWLRVPAYLLDEGGRVTAHNLSASHETAAVSGTRAVAEGASSSTVEIGEGDLVLDLADRPRQTLVLKVGRERNGSEHTAAAADAWELTKRQRLVFELLVEGTSNCAIATKLGCSVRTVELHVTAILQKSGCDSRARLIAMHWKNWALGRTI